MIGIVCTISVNDILYEQGKKYVTVVQFMQNFHSSFPVHLFYSFYEMSSAVFAILAMMCLMVNFLEALPVSKVRR